MSGGDDAGRQPDAGAGEPRDPRAIAAEIDYWVAVCDDLLEINERVGKTAALPVAILTSLLPVAMDWDSMDVAAGEHLTTAGRSAGQIMDELLAIQKPLDRLTGLARGRLAQIQAEVDRGRGEGET